MSGAAVVANAETPVPGPVPRSELASWEERFALVAGITERGAGEPFNLGLTTSEPAARVTERWRAFRDLMRPRFDSFHLAHQCHRTDIGWYESAQPGWHISDDRDGHATSLDGVLLCVTVADCVPIYLARDDGSAFALLHAGWRGTAAGMLEAGVRLLSSRAPSFPPSRLVVHLGAAICGSCYEVGPEVAGAVLGRAVSGKSRLDLRAELARRAEAAGVGEISVSPLCTRCDADRFFSHRAGADGRQVAYLGRARRSGVGD
ncbi:MAG TPA: polyphenol oxidase family protein [Gemmatimonadales bacterium]|nr:polyphenol oxidase family protein [Gemmatimonadales bacterium]